MILILIVAEVIILIGLVCFIYSLLEKWGFWDYISLKSAKGTSISAYRLANCQFCITFHLSLIIYATLIITGVFNKVNWETIFVANGLISLIRR